MEDRKSINFGNIVASSRFARPLAMTVGAFLAMIAFPHVAFAYEVETHAGLTQEITKFYNQSFPDRILWNADIALLMDGSRREDDAPRWMNHYYDPIHNTGLTAIPGNWLSSKAWARDRRAQMLALYNPAKQSTLAFYFTMVDPKPLMESDFTWERAIADYIAGDRTRALTGLGHILHLIQDADVPDHTRNDAHGLGSPYERWAEQFTPANINLTPYLYFQKPIILDSLDAYFDGISNYSNRNFYSKDTIDDPAYAEPKLDYVGREGKYFYGYKNGNAGDYRLIFYKNYSGSLLDSKDQQPTLQDPNNLVLRDYWERLAPKAVQYGAGVIDLFFREVEKAQKNPEQQAVVAPTSLLASIMQWAKGIFGSDEEVVIIPLEEKKLERLPARLNDFSRSGGPRRSTPRNDESKIVSPERVVVSQLPARPVVAVTAAPFQEDNSVRLPRSDLVVRNDVGVSVTPAAATTVTTTCGYASGDGQAVSRRDIIISEVAWAGSEASANDEWIELQNISGSEVDLGHAQLFDKGDQIHIDIPLKTILPAGGFFLLERTNNDTVPGIAADFIYVGALGNSNDGLRLFDDQCRMIDEVVANSDWPAGDAATKRSMERLPDFRWQTYSGVADKGIYGTPKRATLVALASSGSAAPVAVAAALAPVAPTPSRVLISEVSAGTANGAEDEFVELYNPGDAVVDLTGWSLKKRASSGSESTLVSSSAFRGTIQPHSFFLIAHESFVGGPVPDLRYSANSVNLAYSDNSVALYNESGQLIDLAHWVEIPKSGSVERKSNGGGVFAGNGYDTDADSDFDVRAVREPQNSSSLPEPRSGPSPFSSLQLDYDWATLTLALRWDPTLDARGTTTGVLYTVDDVSDTNAPIALGTTSATMLARHIDAVGRDYRFRLTPFDAAGLSGLATTVATSVPSFLTRLDFFVDPRLGANQHLLNLFFDRYPFIPSLITPFIPTWKAIVFSLNHEPLRELFLSGTDLYQPRDRANLLPLRYANYATYNHDSFSFILPDIAAYWGARGGPANNALAFPTIVKQRASARHVFEPRVLSSNDYLTLSYYDFPSSGSQDFEFIATDAQKYYFQDPTPFNASPEVPTNPRIDPPRLGDDPLSVLFTWDQSFDPDGDDSLVSYEINTHVGTSSLVAFHDARWVHASIFATLDDPANPRMRFHSPQGNFALGQTVIFGVRAIDELGTISVVATSTAYVIASS